MNRPFADESDLQLISALQDAPRANWSDLAHILEMGEDTLAERWRRISSAGLAWVSLVDQQDVSGQATTFVLLQTRSGRRSEVLEKLVPDPLVRTVHCVSGMNSIVLLVSTDGPRETEGFIGETLESLHGIDRMQVFPAVGVVTSAAHWRTAALSPAQRRSLARLDQGQADPGMDTAWVRRDPVAGALLKELAMDGRMSTAELARRLSERHGIAASTSTVGRKLTRLLNLPDLRIRCDISAQDLGWQAVVMLWARISSAEAAKLWTERSASAATGRRLLPEMRSMLVLAGPVNLHVTVWLHTLEALPELETRLALWLPSLDIQDRSVVFSTAKRMGFPLTAGRRTARP
ncbi:hypothetical protein GCM10027403_22970 [Arthrobacter tecti]